MPLRSVLYVSRSRLVPPGDMDGLRAIVDWSIEWNGAVGVTGALLSSELHFAQFIEGPEAAVADLLANLRRDRRHTAMDVIESGERDDRLFGDWSLAYAGPNAALDHDILPRLRGGHAPSRRIAATRLVAMMQAMAA